MAGVLESQVAEVKRREEEAALMERERAGLLREQAELEKVVSSASTTAFRRIRLSQLFCLCFFLLCNPSVTIFRRRNGNNMRRQGRKWS